MCRSTSLLARIHGVALLLHASSLSIFPKHLHVDQKTKYRIPCSLCCCFPNKRRPGLMAASFRKLSKLSYYECGDLCLSNPCNTCGCSAPRSPNIDAKGYRETAHLKSRSSFRFSGHSPSMLSFEAITLRRKICPNENMSAWRFFFPSKYCVQNKNHDSPNTCASHECCCGNLGLPEVNKISDVWCGAGRLKGRGGLFYVCSGCFFKEPWPMNCMTMETLILQPLLS
jgi:hypothetical protein